MRLILPDAVMIDLQISPKMSHLDGGAQIHQYQNFKEESAQIMQKELRLNYTIAVKFIWIRLIQI